MTTPPDPLIPFQPNPQEAFAWLRGKTPEELQAIEVAEPCAWCLGSTMRAGKTCEACGGAGKAGTSVLFPGALAYRDKLGKEVREPVLWKIPSEVELTRATKEALAFVRLENPGAKVTTIAEAQALIGEQRFLAIENAATVCLCARSTTAPHGRAYLLPVFLQLPTTMQRNAFFELDTLQKLWDVRVGELTEAQFWAFTSEIARVRNISPFAVLALDLQAPFIVRLACELSKRATSNSHSGSPTDSTPEPSDPQT